MFGAVLYFAMKRCGRPLILPVGVTVDEHRASVLERAAADLDSQLAQRTRFEDMVDELRSWLSPRRYAPGEVLARPDMPSEGLQLLTSGRASAHDAAGTRFRHYGPGDAIWPVEPSDEEAPTVSADASCRTMLLTPAARHRLEEQDERLALKLYRYLLAGRFAGEPTASVQDDAVSPRSSSRSEYDS